MDSGVLTNLKRFVLNGSDEEALLGAIDALLAEICEAMLSLLDDQLMLRYVRVLQTECTKMMDMLTEKIATALGDTVQFLMVNRHLGMLIGHLRCYYPQFYDHDSAMPIFIEQQWKRTFELNGKVMYAQLKGKIQHKELFEVIEAHCKLASELKPYSFSHISRMERFIEHVTTFSRKTEVDGFARRLMDCLVALDFREQEFISLYMLQIKSDLGDEVGAEGQMRVLHDYQSRFLKLKLNVFNDTRVCNGTFEVLSDFISGLVKYAEISAGGVSQTGLHPVRHLRAQSPVRRLKTAFSVDVLAYLAKLHVDCGFLQNTVKSELFHFLAARIETVQVGDALLSAGSIKNKYNQVVESTAVKTRVMLMKMIKQIDRDFKR